MLRMAQGNFAVTQFNPMVNGLGAERFTALSVPGQRVKGPERAPVGARSCAFTTGFRVLPLSSALLR